MTTVFTYAPATGHTRVHHPENAQRLAELLSSFDRHGLRQQMAQLPIAPATLSQIKRVHTAEYIQYIEGLSLRGGGQLNPDTYLTPESYQLALHAAGGCIAVVDAVAGGTARNGLALVRPPGHHAGTSRGEGFCLFNNIAIAARQAQEAHGRKRVLILDFDVHHGNGTQDIFYADDRVLFVSLHMMAPYFYPGTGRETETGRGAGKGYNLNIPFSPGVGDTGYVLALDEIVTPVVRQFGPEMILVSAGFDAHWQDPLAAAGLSLTGYARIVRRLLALADEFCNGQIVFVLEGGYFREALQTGLLNLAALLTGQDSIQDPLGPCPRPETDVTQLLSRLHRRYLPA
jgi:acetoin utilization deacetylase AcuC-like enzyme